MVKKVKKGAATAPPPVEKNGLTLREALETAGRFGAIRNKNYVRVEFKDGKPYHLYDGRWLRPQGLTFSDETVMADGWEAVANCTTLPVEYTTTFAWTQNWALAK